MNSKQKSMAARILAVVLCLALLLPLFSCVSTREETEFAVIYTGGTDGRVETDKDVVGAALVGGFMNKVREKYGDNVLLLDAGNYLYGKSAVTATEGELPLKIMETLKYDALNIGREDLGYGISRLSELDSQTEIPMLSANLQLQQNSEKQFPSFVKKKIGKIKFGVVGVMDSNFSENAKPEQLEGAKLTDTIEAAKKAVDEARKQSHVVVVLADLGTEKSKKLAESVSGIDILIDSGADESLSESGIRVGKTLIVRPGLNGSKIGWLNLKFSGKHLAGVEVNLLDNASLGEFPADPEITALIDASKQTARAVAEVPIGTIASELNGERSAIRTGETNLGDFITNFMRVTTGADIALMTAGSIRDSLKEGPVTRSDIYNLLPYEDRLVTVKIKGNMILSVLEHGFYDAERESGAFPQLAGVKVVVDMAAPSGQRIADYTVNGEPVDPERWYTVALCDNIQRGGEGYTMFKDLPIEKDYGWICDLFETFLKSNGSIYVETEGRIQLMNN